MLNRERLLNIVLFPPTQPFGWVKYCLSNGIRISFGDFPDQLPIRELVQSQFLKEVLENIGECCVRENQVVG